MQTMTHDEWITEAKRRFGDDPLGWMFVCPSCGHVASVRDWKEAGAPEGAVAFSCIGRFVSDGKTAAEKAFKHAGGPCNYTGGGLIKLNPLRVKFENMEKPHQTFAFADIPTRG